MVKAVEVDLQLILDGLNSSDAEERRAAARALPLAGSGAAACSLDVSALLGDESPDVCAAAADAIGALRAFSLGEQLRDCLCSQQPVVAEAACRAVAAWGEDGQTFASDLVACLASKHAGVRIAATRALVAIGGAGLRHGEAVAALLVYSDLGTRSAAVDYFDGAGQLSAPSAADRAASGLSNSDAGIRAACATALGHMRASQHAGSLAALLGSEDTDASAALWGAGLQRKAPPVLRRPACAAAVALGRMGEKATAYADDVAALLDVEQTEYVAAAALGLGLMGAKEYAERLIELLEDRSPTIRAAACQALGALGAQLDNAPGLDHVAIRLGDPHPGVREAAVAALSKVKVEGARYLDDIVSAFDDKVGAVQAAAVRAVGDMGQRGQLYLVRVARIASQGALTGRLAAIEVLGNSADAQDFAEDVLELISDPNTEVRVAALRAVAKMGADAQCAIGKVLEARGDAEPAVRVAADECAAALGA